MRCFVAHRAEEERHIPQRCHRYKISHTSFTSLMFAGRAEDSANVALFLPSGG
jgi:hypothetical protein